VRDIRRRASVLAKTQSMRLLREPLLHFLIAGVLLFGGYEWLNRAAADSTSEGPVRIGLGKVRWLQQTFANQWRRGPTAIELNELLATLLEEELMASEARALGLDRGDTIVRRRLAQKLAFLVDDTTRIADPSEDELRRYYTDHAERYRDQPRISFSHVFFSPARRAHADGDARMALPLASAASGNAEAGEPEGDPVLLEHSYAELDPSAVGSLFGAEFASAVFALTPGMWSGPVKSAFGVHLVRVTQLRPASTHGLEEARPAVTEDWRRERARQTKTAYLARLREKYGVVIEDDAQAALTGATNQSPPNRALKP
jgi:hypothetical protein